MYFLGRSWGEGGKKRGKCSTYHSIEVTASACHAKSKKKKQNFPRCQYLYLFTSKAGTKVQVLKPVLY